MNLRPHREREQPEVSLTPLIDIVFLLLIFFMVSTTFRKESSFDIDLPEASEQPVNDMTDALEITIAADGSYAVNGQLLPDQQRETLAEFLDQASNQARDLPVLIRADAQTPHQAVVRAMDAAGQLGFRRLGIVNVRSPPITDYD